MLGNLAVCSHFKMDEKLIMERELVILFIYSYTLHMHTQACLMYASSQTNEQFFASMRALLQICVLPLVFVLQLSLKGNFNMNAINLYIVISKEFVFRVLKCKIGNLCLLILPFITD